MSAGPRELGNGAALAEGKRCGNPCGRAAGVAAAPRRAGFTLIEMLVVVAILALVLVLLVQRGPLRSRTLDARAAAAGIARTLREARAQAIASDRVVVVRVDTERHRMQGPHGATALPALKIAATATFGRQGARDVAYAFAPDGSASGGRIVLGSGPAAQRIDIDWLSGRIRVVPGT